jgi:hypothetical protein
LLTHPNQVFPMEPYPGLLARPKSEEYHPNWLLIM